jgi:hypothetical protein
MTGCFVAVALGLLGVVMVLATAVAAADTLGMAGILIVLGVLIILGSFRGKRRAARREAEAQRREQERLARSRRRAEQIQMYLPWVSVPVSGTSPLPRPWRMHLDVATKACRDYASCVEAMRPGPIRDRLADQQQALEEAAAQVDTLARRAAELDRQLKALPRAARQGPQAATLQRGIEQARDQLQDRAGGMALIAAQAAHVAMSQSLADAEEVVDSVADLRTTVGGLSAAMEELAPPPPQLDQGLTSRRMEG